MNRKILIMAAIFVLAMNLRSTFLSVTPLIPTIEHFYQLNGSQVGLLTTIPLIVFALFSSLLGSLGAKYGTGKIMVLSIIMIIVGILIRYVGGMYGLFVGTFFIALGIVAGNVLIPALVSAFFPDKVPFMTSIYASLMQVTTGLALATVVPLSMFMGWKETLLVLTLPVYVSLFLWIPLWKLRIDKTESIEARPFDKSENLKEPTPSPTVRQVFRSPLAWYVSIFMGIQSITFYSISTWLPGILLDRGIAYVSIGAYLSGFQVSSLITTFFMAAILKFTKDQAKPVMILCGVYIIGLTMAYFIQNAIMAGITVLLLGISAGGVFAVANMLFVLRTSSPDEASILSGYGQSVGYILAAVAPVLIGYLRDATHGWGVSITLLCVICFVFAYIGYQAGQNKKIPR